jgi:DNA-binding winged helix-turn-helix (wHTH) protein/tetratricopeptide (TPR) repeat protein
MLTGMLYRFGPFELDTAKVELRTGGETRQLERQVFALLTLLVENGDRLVSKDEIVEKVWEGRVVSDAAIASRIKTARQALGDDGKAQRFIKTIHGRGFRFVAPVGVSHVPMAKASSAEASLSRPSIAVLGFRLVGDAGPYAAIADALPLELIAELSRVRWLLVTAHGSSFRLRALDLDMTEAGRLLGVRYCVCGAVEIAGSKLAVTVELVDTDDGALVWGERFVGSVDDVHGFREEIRSRILAALEIQITLREAMLARLTVSENLDAWSAYHLGLQHMYRFNRKDNAAARVLFNRAVTRDSSFARAHAGLSFLHFQTAFLRHTDDLAGETERARRSAERACELDPLDPFVNFTMGRTFWLAGDLESSLTWLERSISISPSFAQGIYARAWAETLAGRGVEGRAHVDLAMRLSPLDPLSYAMVGTRALSHMAEREDADAAEWAERAARMPNAHALIAMIATAAHALAGNDVSAAAWAADVAQRHPALTREDFFRCFPIKAEAMRTRVSSALERFGF